MQLYFLSVLFTLIVGLCLVFTKFDICMLFPGKEKVVTIVTGVLCVLTGLLKFAFVVQPDYVIIGDLLPALAGIIGGITYLIAFYNEKSEVKMQLNSFFDALFVKGKTIVGIACIAIALVHFIFPGLRVL